jgi:hypothetical protein
MKSGIFEVQQRGNLADSDPRLQVLSFNKGFRGLGSKFQRNLDLFGCPFRNCCCSVIASFARLCVGSRVCHKMLHKFGLLPKTGSALSHALFDNTFWRYPGRLANNSMLFPFYEIIVILLL